MGLSQLALVNPCEYRTYECYARASGASDVIDAATSHKTLQSAIADCGVVIGTSARLRSLNWPQLAPAEAARKITSASSTGNVAVVFGRERTGLSNAELALCTALLVVPTQAGFSSLNIAAAVQVVAYEVMKATMVEMPDKTPAETAAPQLELERFYAHLSAVMTDIGYLDPDNPKLLMVRLRRLFNRSEPSSSELQVLRGVLAQMQKEQKKKSK